VSSRCGLVHPQVESGVAFLPFEQREAIIWTTERKRMGSKTQTFDVVKMPPESVIIHAASGTRYEIRKVSHAARDETRAEIVATGLTSGEAIAHRAEMASRYDAVAAGLHALFKGELRRFGVRNPPTDN
jgi:hypothetical protein